MQEHHHSVAEVPANPMQRRGDVGKCPVCGSQVDPEAYHCPKCRSEFCFHCRARVLKPDTELQCINQDCDYYGKLICAVCDPLVEKEEPPSVYAEPEDGYWPAWLVVAVVAAAVLWYFTSFLVAVAIAIAVYAVGGFLLHRAGVNVFGKERKVEFKRKSTFHTCIRCRQRVKQLRGTN